MNKELRKILIDEPHLFGRLLGYDKLLPVHGEWIKYLWDTKESRTLQAHRGARKTTAILAVGVPRYMLLHPDNRVFVCRKEFEKQTVATMREISENIRKPIFAELVKHIYGIQLEINTTADTIQTNLKRRTTKERQVMGFSVNSAMTGFHCERIFNDDIATKEDRYSEAVRMQTRRFYMEQQNIIEPGYGISNSGTPWHIDDCFSIMADPLKFPFGTVPDPDFNEEWLNKQRESMDESLFHANYFLEHVSDADRMFANPQWGDRPSVWAPIAHVDKAYTGDDFTVLTFAQYHENIIYVLGFAWRKNIVDCEEQIVDMCASNNCGCIYAEDNDDKMAYLKKVMQSNSLMVRNYHEGQNKVAKIATYLKAAWPKIKFVHGTNNDYISQICEWTEQARHDDAPDSLASLIRQARWVTVDGERPIRFK